MTRPARDFLNTLLRVWREKQFCAATYRALNPDTHRWPAHLHLARHGLVEGRALAADPVDDLTLRLRLSGHGDGEAFQTLMAHLKAVLRRPGMPLDAELFAQASVVTRVAALWTYRRFVPAPCDRDFSARILKGATELSDAFGLRCARDLAQNAGLPMQDLNASMLSMAGSIDPASQVFHFNCPVFTRDMLPPIARSLVLIEEITNEPRIEDFARRARGFQRVLDAATANGLRLDSAPHLAIRSNGDIRPASEVEGSAGVALRLLMPEYWATPIATDRNLGRMLRLQQDIIRACWQADLWITPYFATPLYDITHEHRSHWPLISYHSISHTDIGALHFKEGAVPGTAFVDSLGYSGWSSLARISRESFAERTQAASCEGALARAATATKYEQPDTTPDLPERFVLAALQIPSDTVAVHAHMQPIAWLEAARSACVSNGTMLIIKRHPKDVSQHTDACVAEICRQPGVRVVEGNITALIAASQAVVTVNSGVGVEAMLAGIPVVTTGASEYRAGATESATPDAVMASLGELLSDPEAWHAAVRRGHHFATIFLADHHLHQNEDGWNAADLIDRIAT